MSRLPDLPVQDSTTLWPDKEWARTKLPSSADADALDALIAHAFSPESHAGMGETHAFVAIHKGAIVAEHFLGGPYTADSTYPSWSMAKSITQLLTGFLVAEGKIDIAAPFDAPEWREPDDPRAAITWTDLLRMASGLEFREDYIDGAVSDVIEMLFASGTGDMGAFAASKALIAPPGTLFNYASGTTNIIARALKNLIGGGEAGMRTFMQGRLFGPLGISKTIPKFDESGTFIGSSYCFMRAEDFARIGLLALRGGRWRGQQLLPASWIDFARTPGPAQPQDGRGYGAQWWLDMFSPGGFSMNGYEGQWVACCPHRDLILVRHGKSTNGADALRQDAARDWLIAAMAAFR
jgi:CubicO group peptidase (beta-lactamase class C family)